MPTTCRTLSSIPLPRPRPTTSWASRASASFPPTARRSRWPTPSSMPCGRSACAISTCRSRHRRFGGYLRASLGTRFPQIGQTIGNPTRRWVDGQSRLVFGCCFRGQSLFLKGNRPIADGQQVFRIKFQCFLVLVDSLVVMLLPLQDGAPVHHGPQHMRIDGERLPVLADCAVQVARIFERKRPTADH